MKKNYAISLVVIVILLTISLSLTTSYGLWKITGENNVDEANLNGCFEIVIPDENTIVNTKIQPLNEENGKATEPYSLSIKNICNIDKKAEIRLNIKDENTMNIKGLTIMVQGDSEQSPTNYNELKNSRADMTGLSQSKKIATLDISPNETIRLNVKMWIDEKITNSINDGEVLNASFDVTDKESINLPTFKETIIENLGGADTIVNRETPNYALVGAEDEGVFAAEDDNGLSYYFRGNVNNNYMSFAGLTWRIIRINGDDTIRLILNDTLDEIAFNEVNNDSIYAGFTFKENEILKSSTIKDYLDNWYNTNIKQYDTYVAISNFCNDANNYINNGHNYYQASARLVGDKIPSLICETNDLSYGGKIRNKVGLITADEVALAGGVYRISNSNYYLNNGTSFYTITPRDYYYRQASMFIVDATGSLGEMTSSYQNGVRPVISLKANTVVIGNGTIDNPYMIDEDANK